MTRNYPEIILLPFSKEMKKTTYSALKSTLRVIHQKKGILSPEYVRFLKEIKTRLKKAKGMPDLNGGTMYMIKVHLRHCSFLAGFMERLYQETSNPVALETLKTIEITMHLKQHGYEGIEKFTKDSD